MSPADFEAEVLRIDALDPSRRAELLGAYLDGELAPERARVVTAWLDDHPDALREVEHLRRTWDLLDAYPDEPVPDDFAARVLARTTRARVRSPYAWIAAAAAVLVAGILLWGLLHGEPSSSPRETELARVDAGGAADTLEEVPPELLGDVDVLLSLSDEEFEGVLIADLDTP